ncbi:MAG: hypothetical protein JWP44_4838 [Mucilaginibacter sp.]|nr:hypothetical protein [Mucilaginibacter sp.]
MNKPAVSKAQIRRRIEALEAMGKTVTSLAPHPDGAVTVLLEGQGSTEPPVDLWAEYDCAHGKV